MHKKTSYVFRGAPAVKRNAKRYYQVPKEEFDKLYQHVSQKIGDEEILIDVENKNIKECIEELKSHQIGI